uniref:Uncharacterized protein n=1 Tax=Vespula pensylvanica TaxID=30213 RepID=A0A834MZG8_VESPE|nr:hypothetical protein H0235_017903 [Vespula pensylvanica]
MNSCGETCLWLIHSIMQPDEGRKKGNRVITPWMPFKSVIMHENVAIGTLKFSRCTSQRPQCTSKPALFSVYFEEKKKEEQEQEQEQEEEEEEEEEEEQEEHE